MIWGVPLFSETSIQSWCSSRGCFLEFEYPPSFCWGVNCWATNDEKSINLFFFRGGHEIYPNPKCGELRIGYLPGTNIAGWETPPWMSRCISYSKWWFPIAMLVYQRVFLCFKDLLQTVWVDVLFFKWFCWPHLGRRWRDVFLLYLRIPKKHQKNWSEMQLSFRNGKSYQQESYI